MSKWTWVTVLSAYGIGALLSALPSITTMPLAMFAEFSVFTVTVMFLVGSGILSLLSALLITSVTNHD